ncbi:MAG: nicotinate-nucleotide adenylyltransferase [Candidatus Omnitrophica bacterium]|nr:nicotinate-nucleotide adenylyltransferase [Candidatus Omnitrophota bacterium]
MGRYGSKKIGIMGGTFDPVHAGHLVIAEQAREEFALGKVIFMPAGIPPHKKKAFAPPVHRFEMVRIAVSGNRYFEASDMEIKRKKPSYTYDTVSLVQAQNPGAEIFFITGEDAFYELKTWYRYKGLVRKTVFLVAPRGKKRRIPEMPFLKYEFIDSPCMEISSSYIRDCLLHGKTVKYLVPDRVLGYIRRHCLYGA